MLGLLLLLRRRIYKFYIFLSFVTFSIIFHEKPGILLSRATCPDCFGDEMCGPLANGEIRLSWFSKLLSIANPQFTKSVFHAKLNGSRDLVLKSVTRRSQIKTRSRKYGSYGRDVLKHVIQDNFFVSDGIIQNVVLCGNVESFHVLFREVDKNVSELLENKNLWLDLQISIEPLLLKNLVVSHTSYSRRSCLFLLSEPILSLLSEGNKSDVEGKQLPNPARAGFGLVRAKILIRLPSDVSQRIAFKFLAATPNMPVPRYYGACGDVIFEEYKGEPLTNYLDSSWMKKVFLSSQLLKMAEIFTFFHPLLIFYFMDVSPDNIAVNSSGAISLIDLDHVIITERTLTDNGEMEHVHVSQVLDPEKFAVTPSDLCKNPVSDHNYFAVCKYIIWDSSQGNKGLLGNIPESTFEKHKNLKLLLDECSQPVVYRNRIVAGRLLTKILDEITSEFEWEVIKRGVIVRHTEMVVNFKVFKKSSPNGKLVLYLGKRDYVDHVTSVDPIDGVVLIEKEYLVDHKIFAQVICSFRYGREEDEVMGLTFQKDLYLASGQIYPPVDKPEEPLTKLQERLVAKLGENAYPFKFKIPTSAPGSVTLQPGPEDQGEPCGVQYYVKIFSGQTESDKAQTRSVVTLRIRKVQFAPTKQGKQPCTIVRKDFMLSPGELELEATLDKQLYHHGEKIAVNICIRNHSNKIVKRIKAMIQQGVDIVLFQNGQYRSTVASLETQEGCPIQPGSSLQKIIYLLPSFESNKNRRGIAVEGRVKDENVNLASSTIFASADGKDAFGIIVSYTVKVKLYLGALGGELSAELPMLLMHPKPGKEKAIREGNSSDVDLDSTRESTEKLLGQ